MIVEICVDTLDGAVAAIEGGADRIELCSSLSEGGLTPSVGLMRAAAKLSKPSYAMIRPRAGLFHYTDAEAAIMLEDIAAAREAGLAGIVLGARGEDGALNVPLLETLGRVAGDLGKTLHRVIDVVPDPLVAIDQVADLGFDRVLTSGTKPFAPDGIPMIRQMIERAAGRLSVMPGCGLTPDNVAHVLEATGATEAHAACAVPAPGDPAFSDFDPPRGRYVTSADEVRRFVAALG